MQLIQRNWEKLVFFLSLILLALAGYRIYLDVQISSDDEQISEVKRQVQEQLNRSPSAEATDPGFSEQLDRSWSPLEQSPPGKTFTFYMPPIVRPTPDLSPDQKCVLPGIAQINGEGEIGKVNLSWSFQQVPEGEGVSVVEPGVVEVQRREQGSDSWSTVTEFSGTDNTEFTDSNAKPRASYSYRVRVGSGGKTCDAGTFEEKEKFSEVLSVEVKSDLQLVLKSVSQNAVLVEVQKRTSDDSQSSSEGFWVEEGDKIGEGSLSTPFTLTSIEPDAKFSYYTLVARTEWVEEPEEGGDAEQKNVGVIKRESVTRPKITYRDESGKTFELWRVRDQEYSNRITPPPPWETQQRNQFDTFRVYPDEMWGIPTPEAYRAESKSSSDDGEQSTDDTTGSEGAEEEEKGDTTEQEGES